MVGQVEALAEAEEVVAGKAPAAVVVHLPAERHAVDLRLRIGARLVDRRDEVDAHTARLDEERQRVEAVVVRARWTVIESPLTSISVASVACCHGPSWLAVVVQPFIGTSIVEFSLC